MPMKLGEIITQRSLVTLDELYEGLREQMVSGVRIGTALVQLGYLQVDDLGRSLSIQHGVPHADADLLQDIEPEILKMLPAVACGTHNVIPMAMDGDVLNVAMAKPSRSIAGELSFILGLAVNRFVAPELRIVYFLERYYHIPRSPRFLRTKDSISPDKDRRTYLAATVKQTGVMQPTTSDFNKKVDVISLEDEPEDADADDQDDLPIEFDEEAFETRLPTAEYRPVKALRRVDVLVEKIRQAESSEVIDRLLVEPFLDRTALSVLFWTREKFAIGSVAHGTPAAATHPQTLVVSLEQPSMMRYALQTRGIIRGAGEHDKSQAKIAKQMESGTPGEVCVAPVLLEAQATKLLCLHSRPGKPFPDDAPVQLRELAEHAAAAYKRLAQ